jgi:hypothetical protein
MVYAMDNRYDQPLASNNMPQAVIIRFVMRCLVTEYIQGLEENSNSERNFIAP